jgi:Zn-dependent protease with chaperone function
MMESAQKDQEGTSKKKEKAQLDLFSSHPLTSERIQYLSADER